MVKGLAIMSCRFGIDGQCRSLEDIAIEFYGSLFLSLFFCFCSSAQECLYRLHQSLPLASMQSTS